MSLELYNQQLKKAKALCQPHIKMLERIDGDAKTHIGIALHNQNAWNDNRSVVVMPEFLKKISIPATAYVLSSLPNFYSIQPLQRRNDYAEASESFYLSEADKIESMKPVSTVYGYSNCQLDIKTSELDKLKDHDTDAALAQISVALANQIMSINLATMRGVKVPAKKEVHSSESVVQSISETSEEMKCSIGQPANFLVMSTMIAHFIREQIATEYNFDKQFVIQKIGCLKNRWKVYLDESMGNRILVGYRGNHYVDAGMIYSPDVLFTTRKKSKDIICIEVSDTSVVTRPDYYASIELISPRNTDLIETFENKV